MAQTNASSRRTPARKSSIAVLSPRLCFGKSVSSFRAEAFFPQESSDLWPLKKSSNDFVLRYGWFSAAVVKAFPLWFYLGSNARHKRRTMGRPYQTQAIALLGFVTSSLQPPAQTPKVYRAMKRNPADDLPVVGSTSSSDLGARPGIDITVDTAGNVVLDVSGMSVAPSWRDLDFTRIPKRLRHIVPGATGANSTSCFTMGTGPFQNGVVANGLESIPDLGRAPVTHGVIAPIQVVALAQYQTDLENTRAAWQIDET